MNHLKDNPIGIDCVIQEMQELIHSDLGLDINGYGRIYSFVKDSKTIPMFHVKNNDFKEVIPTKKDESLGCFFFIESSKTKSQLTISSTDVDIVFIVDVFNAFKNIKHAPDEELKLKISELLKRSRFFYETECTITKGKEALSEFHTDIKHLLPYCLMRFSGSINYQLN